MEIQVNCRSKARKALIESIANLYARELNLERCRGFLAINTIPGLIKSMNFRGGCMQLDKGFITVALDSRLNIEDLCTVLAHEMVHVKQYALGQLRAVEDGYTWLGNKYEDNYYDTPWELEAFGRERILANKVAKIIAGV